MPTRYGGSQGQISGQQSMPGVNSPLPIPQGYQNPNPFSLANQVNPSNPGDLSFVQQMGQMGMNPGGYVHTQNQGQGVPNYGTGNFQGWSNPGGSGGGGGAGGTGVSGNSGLFPSDMPDYIGQVGGAFNNYQPYDFGSPDLSGMFSGLNDLAGSLGNAPQIPVNDVISGQMQNQMLNSAIGANAAQRQTGMRDATRDLGGRGFTSESPALQATSNRLGLNEALANTQARTDIPIQSAQQNAQHRLSAMQANMGQRNQDFQNRLGVENARTNRMSPLLSALVGLV